MVCLELSAYVERRKIRRRHPGRDLFSLHFFFPIDILKTYEWFQASTKQKTYDLSFT